MKLPSDIARSHEAYRCGPEPQCDSDRKLLYVEINASSIRDVLSTRALVPMLSEQCTSDSHRHTALIPETHGQTLISEIQVSNLQRSGNELLLLLVFLLLVIHFLGFHANLLEEVQLRLLALLLFLFGGLPQAEHIVTFGR